MFMNGPERSDDTRTFVFLAGIAAAGLIVAIGFHLIWGALIPRNDPLPKAAIFDPALRVALSEYGTSVTETRAVFTASTPQGTRTVSNCSDYMKLLNQGVRAAAGEPDDVLDAYRSCPVLFLLRQARQPDTYLAPLSHLAGTIAERLDVATLPAEFRPPLEAKDDNSPFRPRYVVDEENLLISSADGSWSMTILASGSFSGDGREDIAARIDRGGSRRYVILSARPDGSLDARSPESLAMTTTLPVRLR
ncbi:hypothetical protein JL100_001975 [Skermanella mucosa]|uniref:hypothetical protein n=1 Tax=Skermanella mucosa TaxID=1789672 RepID=UPI00192B8BF7|nr:hypothetical protein [Skermanella mucosa]UEM21563.1 hypothetical protein JL100_001975 [Skermanella mucosa]